MTGRELAARAAAIMREAADAVIMPRYRSLASDEVREKTGPRDLVTIADIESERRMTPALRDLVAGSAVIGEEAAEENPAILELLRDPARPVWVVDPVDGTLNFAKGGRHFCVMVALIRGDRTELGVILDPLGETWAAAWAGGGAWRYSYDGSRPVRLEAAADVPAADMSGALNLRFLGSEGRVVVRERADAAVGRHYRLGCAGHEYLRLANGTAHFVIHGKNMPWDHAAGCLIHSEAGGVHARFDGRDYRPSELAGGLLAAPGRSGWRALRDGLLDGIRPPSTG